MKLDVWKLAADASQPQQWGVADAIEQRLSRVTGLSFCLSN
jgi:hypothetical protein